jgi:tetratricopeptide (TPR) repeat protein
MNRIELLEEFYKEQPNDPFNLYSLCLEYKKVNTKKAINLFNQLLQDFPQYLPTYYMAAEFFIEENFLEEALNILNKGMDLAKNLGETKTFNELKNAKTNLEFEME